MECYTQPMTDPVLYALISAGQAVALAGIAAWLKRGQLQAQQKSEEHHAETQQAVETVRQDVNGKVAELLRISGDAREAKGNLEGRAEEKAERLPAIMTVPLILFILPVLFIVILGPAACSISDAFKGGI